jgi:L-lysine exporter family protein LysE/ArgO
MSLLWSGLLLSLSLCLDLGIVNVAIITTALQRGGLAGFLVGLGSCLGDLFYFLVAAMGAAALLRWAPVRWVVWIGGTSVLLFLTWRMAREVVRPHELALDGAEASRDDRTRLRLFVWGFSLALASPTAILWFAAVGGSVISASGVTGLQLVPFAAGFLVAGVVWSFALSHGVAVLRRVGGRRIVRALSLASALLFLYFAVRVFLNGFTELRAQ